jgi:hypothetical protein
MGYSFQLARNDSVSLGFSLCTILYLQKKFKGTVPRDFWLQVFLMNQFPPSPWISHWGHFEFVLKCVEIFAAQGAPPLTLVANLQRWPHNCFFKSSNSWAQSTIAHLQILRYTSPQISFDWSANCKKYWVCQLPHMRKVYKCNKFCKSTNVTNFVSPQICGFSEAWGKKIHKKTWSKNLVTLSF